MHYFDSSAIHGADYNAETRTLFLQFAGGEKIYESERSRAHLRRLANREL